ncbi:hypothetical protein HPB50_012550 [Hyalomma asiaticum]|uniref:Uncharacterized protein n=1 Tax=Hyalomma asiaticum TaxID=266040 RepID=A0ACB7S549_HYAAI|nr:hypothetical protein HPB50_012550 [Hyalomma asiaticum]
MVVEQQQQQQQGGTQSSEEEENDVQFRHIACRPATSNKPFYTPPSVDDYRSAHQSEPANRFHLNNEQQRRAPYSTQRYRTPHPMVTGYRGYENRDRYPMLVDGYEGFEHHREIRPSPGTSPDFATVAEPFEKIPYAYRTRQTIDPRPLHGQHGRQPLVV